MSVTKESAGKKVNQRQSRARTLVVGDAEMFAQVEPHLRSTAVGARNLFDAMGELTIATATSPFDSILISSSVVREASPQAISVLEKLEKGLRLVLVEDADGAADSTSRRDLFDAEMTAPITRQSLSRTLGVERMQEVSDTPVETTTPRDMPNRATHDEDSCDTVDSPEITVVPFHGRGAHHAVVSDTSLRPYLHDHANNPIDDNKLVKALLDSDVDFHALLMQEIKQRTGWSGVTLSDNEGVPVECNDRQYGSLNADNIADEELEPWAQWLAPWLALHDRLEHQQELAWRDDLTGAWNRRYFREFASAAFEFARDARQPVTIMVFDIDDFKIYNDQYGHQAGDEILRETVQLLESVIRSSDRVCRIGGDEFAVVFTNPEGPREEGSSHPETVETIARRFQNQVCKLCFPKLGPEAAGRLTISAGLATFPWDGDSVDALVDLADQRALHSKRNGKNAITFGPKPDHE